MQDVNRCRAIPKRIQKWTAKFRMQNYTNISVCTRSFYTPNIWHFSCR